jgi:hypothetical protein
MKRATVQAAGKDRVEHGSKANDNDECPPGPTREYCYGLSEERRDGDAWIRRAFNDNFSMMATAKIVHWLNQNSILIKGSAPNITGQTPPRQINR